MNDAQTTALALGPLLTQLGGGLALFLYGMSRMTDGLSTVAGTGMKNLLAKLTANRFTAALAGAVITAVIQSSSVTTVLVVGFISAGLLTLGQSIGVILGANVGTTVTAQIIAFQVYKYGLVLIAVGFFTEVLARRERIRHWGTVIMGLGLIFFGMELMSIATGPLRAWPPFIELMQGLAHPALAVLVGAAFTAIVQSSSATTGIVIVLASQGLLSLESGIGLIFGANIGTCVTAFVSAIGRPREALQAAWVHIVFNVAGVLLWIGFIGPFADMIRSISPVSDSLHSLESLAADTPRQIANAHTLFNVANAVLFIWFTGPLSRLVQRLVPSVAPTQGVRAHHLDKFYLEQPALALDVVRRELGQLGELARAMITHVLDTSVRGSDAAIASLSRADDEIDALYSQIIRYLGQLSQKSLVEPQTLLLQQYVGIANYLENIGDVIDKDLLTIAAKRRRLGVAISDATIAKLKPIHEEVCRSFDRALAAVESGDPQAAMDATESKQTVDTLADEATAHLVQRLVVNEPNRIEAFQLETDIIENLRRLHAYTRRIARLAVGASAGGLELGSAPRDGKAEPASNAD